jgi:hypothetical protein
MAVPVVILLAAFAGGAVATARWLPPLAAGAVGRLAFGVVCGLVGIAVALVGLNVYEVVRQLDQATTIGGVGPHKADILASGLTDILRDVGPVIGLAAAVYLLAPAVRAENRLGNGPISRAGRSFEP